MISIGCKKKLLNNRIQNLEYQIHKRKIEIEECKEKLKKLCEVKNMKNNNAIMIPTKTLLVLFFIICIAILAYAFFITENLGCDLENEVELTGLLRGFTKNETYWNVKLGGETYLFFRFDRDYMQSMIGYNIIIQCCYQNDMSYRIGYYNLVACFINEVN